MRILAAVNPLQRLRREFDVANRADTRLHLAPRLATLLKPRHATEEFEERVVLDTANFLCFAPFASRFPFELWIVPKNHTSHYENIQKNDVEELGTVLKMVLLKLEVALDKPAYNYIIHTSPLDSQPLKHYHWHIEIIPRLTRVAGFEWGTGFYINPVPPEQAAACLRETEVDLMASR